MAEATCYGCHQKAMTYDPPELYFCTLCQIRLGYTTKGKSK